MLKVFPLYSSSSGNMFNISSDKTDILLDVGVSYKAVNEGLKSIDKTISDISAVLITHEHVDHIKGLSLLCRKNNIPIYACGKTAFFIDNMLKEKNIQADVIKIEYGQPFKIKELEITAFETSHDAVSPCGYSITCKDKKLTYATDLGYVSNEVFDYLKDSNYTILEANYDKTMLDFGKYPYPLKHRIKSNLGHLSNEDCANTLVKLANMGTTDFLLAHLSENNNNPFILQNEICAKFEENDMDFSDFNINIASKELSSEGYIV